MNQEYIQKLREHLKGFSTEEQQALIEEINSHMESAMGDPNMGKDADKGRKGL